MERVHHLESMNMLNKAVCPLDLDIYFKLEVFSTGGDNRENVWEVISNIRIHPLKTMSQM